MDSPGWFVLHALRRAIDRAIASLTVPEMADVLDYGCGDSPYRSCLPPAARYVGADLSGNPNASLVLRADGTVPCAEASMDLVLSTQVLEHVASPDRYLEECMRVLRPGGALVLSTHGFWSYHRDPVDYWRWTGEGLAFIARRNGFEVLALDGIGGLSAIAVQLFQDATLHRLPGMLRPVYAFALQRLVRLCDAFHAPASRRDNAMVFVVVARKPSV